MDKAGKGSKYAFAAKNYSQNAHNERKKDALVNLIKYMLHLERFDKYNEKQ